MKYEVIKLMPESQATLTVYLRENNEEISIKKRPFILVIPGGGYEGVSEREAEPVVSEFYRMGYHVGVLRYSVGPDALNLQPMKEGITAIKMLREKAGEWNIIADRIAVCGFSAGGHLACSLGVMWQEPKLMEALDYKDDRYKPNAMILCYPVLIAGVNAHQGSLINISGSEDLAKQEFFSLEKRVDKSTPPTFIWHTVDDDCVPVENTLYFIGELQKNQISYDAHLFRSGNHGISVCSKETDSENAHCGNWIPLCEEWLKDVFS